MSLDMFLSFDGKIKGESKDAQHKGQIDILEWRWGMDHPGDVVGSASGRTGPIRYRYVTVTKYVDRASPIFMKYCTSSQVIDRATLIVRKAAGKKPIEYYKLIMFRARVVGISVGADKEEDDLIKETVTLNFNRIDVEYLTQKDDGSPGDTITVILSVGEQ